MPKIWVSLNTSALDHAQLTDKIVQQPWLLHELIHKLNKLKAWKLWNSLKAFVTLCCLSSWSRAWHADSDEFTSQMIGDSKQLLDHPSAFTSSECGDPRLEICFVDCSKLRLLAPMKLWQRLPQRMSMIFTWYVLYFSPILAQSWLLGWRGLNMLEHAWTCLNVWTAMFDSAIGQVLKHSEAHPGIKPCVRYWISIVSWLKTSSCTLQFPLCVKSVPKASCLWPRHRPVITGIGMASYSMIINDLSESIAVPAVQIRRAKDKARRGLVICAPNLYCRHCDRHIPTKLVEGTTAHWDQLPTDSTISKVSGNEEENTKSYIVWVYYAPFHSYLFNYKEPASPSPWSLSHQADKKSCAILCVGGNHKTRFTVPLQDKQESTGSTELA